MSSSWQGSEYPTLLFQQHGELCQIYLDTCFLPWMCCQLSDCTGYTGCRHCFLYNRCLYFWEDWTVLCTVAPCLSVDSTNASGNAVKQQRQFQFSFSSFRFINQQKTIFLNCIPRLFISEICKWNHSVARSISIKLVFLRSHLLLFIEGKEGTGPEQTNLTKESAPSNSDMVLSSSKGPISHPQPRREADRNRKQEHSGDKW